MSKIKKIKKINFTMGYAVILLVGIMSTANASKVCLFNNTDQEVTYDIVWDNKACFTPKLSLDTILPHDSVTKICGDQGFGKGATLYVTTHASMGGYEEQKYRFTNEWHDGCGRLNSLTINSLGPDYSSDIVKGPWGKY